MSDWAGPCLRKEGRRRARVRGLMGGGRRTVSFLDSCVAQRFISDDRRRLTRSLTGLLFFPPLFATRPASTHYLPLHPRCRVGRAGCLGHQARTAPRPRRPTRPSYNFARRSSCLRRKKSTCRRRLKTRPTRPRRMPPPTSEVRLSPRIYALHADFGSPGGLAACS